MKCANSFFKIKRHCRTFWLHVFIQYLRRPLHQNRGHRRSIRAFCCTVNFLVGAKSKVGFIENDEEGPLLIFAINHTTDFLYHIRMDFEGYGDYIALPLRRTMNLEHVGEIKIQKVFFFENTEYIWHTGNSASSWKLLCIRVLPCTQ